MYMVSIVPGRAIPSASTAEDMVFAVNIPPTHTCTKSWQNKGFMYSLWWFRDYKLTTWAWAWQCTAFNMIQFFNVNKTSSIWTNGLCKDHVNVIWVCEVMWVSCVAYTWSKGGHMISHTSIMFCASRLFPSRLQPGSMVPPYKLMPIWGCRFWNLQDRVNRRYLSGSSGCQAVVVKVRVLAEKSESGLWGGLLVQYCAQK